MRTTNDNKDAVIYESPDGGQTIWVRYAGSSDRRLFYRNDKKYNLEQRIEKIVEIIKNCGDDPEINDLLEKLEVLYHLKSSNS